MTRSRRYLRFKNRKSTGNRQSNSFNVGMTSYRYVEVFLNRLIYDGYVLIQHTKYLHKNCTVKPYYHIISPSLGSQSVVAIITYVVRKSYHRSIQTPAAFPTRRRKRRCVIAAAARPLCVELCRILVTLEIAKISVVVLPRPNLLWP
jgi:hypothetical protein